MLLLSYKDKFILIFPTDGDWRKKKKMHYTDSAWQMLEDKCFQRTLRASSNWGYHQQSIWRERRCWLVHSVSGHIGWGGWKQAHQHHLPSSAKLWQKQKGELTGNTVEQPPAPMRHAGIFKHGNMARSSRGEGVFRFHSWLGMWGRSASGTFTGPLWK